MWESEPRALASPDQRTKPGNYSTVLVAAHERQGKEGGQSQSNTRHKLACMRKGRDRTWGRLACLIHLASWPNDKAVGVSRLQPGSLSSWLLQRSPAVLPSCRPSIFVHRCFSGSPASISRLSILSGRTTWTALNRHLMVENNGEKETRAWGRKTAASVGMHVAGGSTC
jgi:hypothetical protein